MIYVPGVVRSTLHVLSTYSSPQPYGGRTTILTPVLQMKKQALESSMICPQPQSQQWQSRDLIRGALTPQPEVLTSV